MGEAQAVQGAVAAVAVAVDTVVHVALLAVTFDGLQRWPLKNMTLAAAPARAF